MSTILNAQADRVDAVDGGTEDDAGAGAVVVVSVVIGVPRVADGVEAVGGIEGDAGPFGSAVGPADVGKGARKAASVITCVSRVYSRESS